MLPPRVIPVLLCDQESSLVKTRKFKKPVYIGDPLNAVKIFNDKEVDELIFLDIKASIKGIGPNLRYLRDVASEAFMPLCYGGGLQTVEDVTAVIKSGFEKVSLNSALEKNADLISRCSEKYGKSATVVSMDVKKDFWGKYRVAVKGANRMLDIPVKDFAQMVEEKGAGEILLNSVDRDGEMDGMDVNLIRMISSSVSIPVVACGGAGKLEDLKEALRSGASAVAAGSMFVFQGKHRAVLISYPSPTDLQLLSNL